MPSASSFLGVGVFLSVNLSDFLSVNLFLRGGDLMKQMNLKTLAVVGAMAIVMISATAVTAVAGPGYWRFEEASGNAIDEEGNANGTWNWLAGTASHSGTIFGSPVPLTGATNTQSMEFSGLNSGDRVNMGTSPEPDASDFTLEAWVNLRTDGADNYPLIAGKLITGSHLDRGFELMARPDGPAGPGQWNARFAIRFGGSQDQVFSPDLDYDTWYHLAGVREGTGADAVKLYVDGVLAGTASTAHTSLTSGQNFTVGGSTTNGSREFDGFIDEVRFTRSALQPSQFLNIPEPGSAALLLMGISVLLGFRKR
jgi:hypothetical protein